MTDSKHTPGPWWIAGEGSIRYGDRVDGTGWIASVNWRNRAANARLIAAAPDLLAHSRDLLASLDSDTLNPEQFNAWCALSAAVSKAQDNPQ